jgi:ribonuclease HI
MAFKYEELLNKKYKEFTSLLKGEGVVSGKPSFYEYCVKFPAAFNGVDYGKLVIYYKPSKNTYSLVTQELKNEQLGKEIKGLWEKRPAKKNISIDSNAADTEYSMYVDGSYLNGAIGYGVVILRKEEIVKEIFGRVTDPLFTVSRQVGGEIAATQEALKWCMENNIDRVSVYYDFENIKKWATGEYKANNPMTQMYRDFMKSCRIEILWNKVASHTGVEWNERADQLAKKGTKENL